jgi:hypothetical protein
MVTWSSGLVSPDASPDKTSAAAVNVSPIKVRARDEGGRGKPRRHPPEERAAEVPPGDEAKQDRGIQDERQFVFDTLDAGEGAVSGPGRSTRFQR